MSFSLLSVLFLIYSIGLTCQIPVFAQYDLGGSAGTGDYFGNNTQLPLNGTARDDMTITQTNLEDGRSVYDSPIVTNGVIGSANSTSRNIPTGAGTQAAGSSLPGSIGLDVAGIVGLGEAQSNGLIQSIGSINIGGVSLGSVIMPALSSLGMPGFHSNLISNMNAFGWTQINNPSNTDPQLSYGFSTGNFGDKGMPYTGIATNKNLGNIGTLLNLSNVGGWLPQVSSGAVNINTVVLPPPTPPPGSLVFQPATPGNSPAPGPLPTLPTGAPSTSNTPSTPDTGSSSSTTQPVIPPGFTSPVLPPGSVPSESTAPAGSPSMGPPAPQPTTPQSTTSQSTIPPEFLSPTPSGF